MSLPPEPAPPEVIGAQPINANEVNNKVGSCLRDFLRIQQTINQNQSWLAGADLKLAPYYFTETQETDLKSATST
jgi:hypothetical protein